MCSGEYRLGAVGALTESTATVPVETWVIETDAVGVGFTDLSGTSRNRESLIGGSLLIGGVAENLDLQFGFDGWLSSEQRTDLATDRVTGIGDTWLRFKWNFAGDEVSGAAWSTLPYIKIPSGDSGVSNGIWEPGIALIYGQPFGDAGILNAHLQSIPSREILAAGRSCSRGVSLIATIPDGLASWAENTLRIRPVRHRPWWRWATLMS